MSILWHNPRCSKSRAALALLQGRGIEPTIRRYLEDTPSVRELERVSGLLDGGAIALMRRTQPEFKEMGLSDSDPDEVLLQAMTTHPTLIERPVFLHEGRAVIGRPPERVLDIL